MIALIPLTTVSNWHGVCHKRRMDDIRCRSFPSSLDIGKAKIGLSFRSHVTAHIRTYAPNTHFATGKTVSAHNFCGRFRRLAELRKIAHHSTILPFYHSQQKERQNLFRQTLKAALLSIYLTSGASAQQNPQPEAYIADLWQVYVSRCGLALEDQQSFLNSLPPTNTGGGPNAVTTADRVILVSSTSQNGFTVDADMIAQSSGLYISCHVWPSSRMFELENFSASEIENTLQQFLISQGLQQPSGGKLKDAFTGPQDGDEVEYNYAFELTMAGETVLTRFDMGEGGFLDIRFDGVHVVASN